jgi:hypothetical protein
VHVHVHVTQPGVAEESDIVGEYLAGPDSCSEQVANIKGR